MLFRTRRLSRTGVCSKLCVKDLPMRTAEHPHTEGKDMKKFLVAFLVLALLAGAATFLYRDRIGMILAFGRMKPSQPYATATVPAAPDYSKPESWAALPDKHDAAGVLPSNDVHDAQATAT